MRRARTLARVRDKSALFSRRTPLRDDVVQMAYHNRRFRKSNLVKQVDWGISRMLASPDPDQMDCA